MALEPLERRVVLAVVGVPEFGVNSTQSNTQQTASPRSVASDASGNSVVVWQSFNQDSLLTWGIYGQRLDSDGDAVGGEFLVNTVSLLDNQQRPSVAMNGSGRFAVCWDGGGLLGLFPGIYVQRYNNDGTELGTEIGVAGSALLSVSNAAIGMDADGDFVVVYEAVDALLSRGVFARRYSADGTPVGAAFRVNPATGGNQTSPQIAVRSDGSFVVAWQGEGAGDTSGVFARAYDASGAALGGEVLVNETTSGSQGSAVVAAIDSGGFVIAWAGNGAGDTDGVYVRRFDADAEPLAGEVLVNQTTGGSQAEPTLALDADEDFVVAWSGAGAADATGVYWREYAGDGISRTSEALMNTTTGGSQNTPTLVGAGDNRYVLAWSGEGPVDTVGVLAAMLANAPPAVTVDSGVLAYSENEGLVVAAPGATVSDADSEALISARVTISSGYDSATDTLDGSLIAGFTVSFDGMTGVLTISGSGTVAQYQAALRLVRLRIDGDNPQTHDRVLSLEAFDGTDWGTAVTRTVEVTAVNDAPVVGVDSGELPYTEGDGWVTVAPGATISDPDSTTLTSAQVRIASGYVLGEDALDGSLIVGLSAMFDSASGTLTIAGSGTLAQYQAALRLIRFRTVGDDPSSVDRIIEFRVFDGSDWSADASRTVEVAPVNDAPALTVDLDPLAYSEGDGWVVVDPAAAISDPDSAMLSSTRITISSGHDPMTDALDGSLIVGFTVSFDAMAGVLTISGAGTVAQYQAAIRLVRLSIGGDSPSTADRTIRFEVFDGADWSNAADRAVDVAAVNDPPAVTVDAGTLSYTEGDGLVPVSPGAMIADADSITLAEARVMISAGYDSATDTLDGSFIAGFTVVFDGMTGVLTISGSGTIAQYQAAIRQVRVLIAGDDPQSHNRQVSFEVFDGTNWSAATARTMAASAINDAPALTVDAGPLSYTEGDGWIVVAPSAALTDPDSAMLTMAEVRINSGYVSGQDVLDGSLIVGLSATFDGLTGILTVSGAGTVAEYQAALRLIRISIPGDDPATIDRTIEFRVHDGSTWSNTAARTVEVAAINDPAAISVDASILSYIENDGWVFAAPGAIVSDVDSATLTSARITFTSGYDPATDTLDGTLVAGLSAAFDGVAGVLTISGTATIAQYQAALRAVRLFISGDNPSMADRMIRLEVFDGADWSNAAERTVEVAAVNDASALTVDVAPLPYTEGDGWITIANSATVGDVDSAILTSARVSVSSGYDPDTDMLDGSLVVGLSVVFDGVSGTLTITGAGSVAQYQSALRAIRLLIAGDAPNATDRTIEFSVNDGSTWSAPAARTITVTPINDAPVVNVTAAQIEMEAGSTPSVLDPMATISDADSLGLSGLTVAITAGLATGDQLVLLGVHPALAAVWNPSLGTLTISGSGSIAEYQSALRSVAFVTNASAAAAGNRQIEVGIDDGSGGASIPTTVSVVVAYTPPPPPPPPPPSDPPPPPPPTEPETPTEPTQPPEDSEEVAEPASAYIQPILAPRGDGSAGTGDLGTNGGSDGINPTGGEPNQSTPSSSSPPSPSLLDPAADPNLNEASSEDTDEPSTPQGGILGSDDDLAADVETIDSSAEPESPDPSEGSPVHRAFQGPTNQRRVPADQEPELGGNQQSVPQPQASIPNQRSDADLTQLAPQAAALAWLVVTPEAAISSSPIGISSPNTGLTRQFIEDVLGTHARPTIMVLATTGSLVGGVYLVTTGFLGLGAQWALAAAEELHQFDLVSLLEQWNRRQSARRVIRHARVGIRRLTS